MPTRRDPFTFEAFEPNGGTCSVYIREKQLLTLAKLTSPAHLLSAKEIVPEVLAKPTVVFEGLRWEEDEDKNRPGWRCYCARPSFRFDKGGRRVGSDPSQVFVVFVNDERIAYNWRWEPVDENDAEIPAGESRFITKIFDQREIASA